MRLSRRKYRRSSPAERIEIASRPELDPYMAPTLAEELERFHAARHELGRAISRAFSRKGRRP